MDKSQWYIGTPNGVVLCIDHMEKTESGFFGRIYHAYSEKEQRVHGVAELLFELEHFYDSINFPHPGTNERTFQNKVQNTDFKEGMTKIMSDEKLLSKHGDLGTFIIRVQHRQNSSWQGRITWMDRDKTVYFRSVWEMIKLIASALEMVSEPEDDPLDKAWMEEE